MQKIVTPALRLLSCTGHQDLAVQQKKKASYPNPSFQNYSDNTECKPGVALHKKSGGAPVPDLSTLLESKHIRGKDSQAVIKLQTQLGETVRFQISNPLRHSVTKTIAVFSRHAKRQGRYEGTPTSVSSTEFRHYGVKWSAAVMLQMKALRWLRVSGDTQSQHKQTDRSTCSRLHVAWKPQHSLATEYHVKTARNTFRRWEEAVGCRSIARDMPLPRTLACG